MPSFVFCKTQPVSAQFAFGGIAPRASTQRVDDNDHLVSCRDTLKIFFLNRRSTTSHVVTFLLRCRFALESRLVA